MSQFAIESTERVALAAARAEGRTEGAEDIRNLVTRWMVELEHIARGELGADAVDIVARFSGALESTLAGKLEEYRREQSRAIDRYVVERRQAELHS